MSVVFNSVAHFDIVRELLPRGGMGSVFLASDRRDGKQVALKLVGMQDDPDAYAAEKAGAHLQAQMAAVCPLVPKIYEEGTAGAYYFIAMEFVDGETLSNVIARGALPIERALAIASDLCRFLETAHAFPTEIDGRASGAVIHCDLKPRNIRIAASGETRVLDFGIAKALALSRKVTRNDFGSIPYFSPERLESNDVNTHTDLWALGVILYEMLGGALPFRAADTARLEHQIRLGYASHPLPEDCPLGLRAMVSRLLAPELRDRYQAAGEVLADIRRFEAGESTDAEAHGWPARADDLATRRTTARAEDQEATRRTTAPAPRPAEPQPAAVAVAPPPPATATGAKPAAPRKGRKFRAFVMVIVIALALNEMSVSFDARRLAGQVPARDLEELSATWDEYQPLLERSKLRIGVMRLEYTLVSRTKALAEQVIANFRTPTPTVRERQWSLVRSNLIHALALKPGDREMLGALRYVEGHLKRIDGEAARRRGQNVIAKQHFTDAVTAFREAAEERPRWPDPFLGLARTFIYGLEDIDRAADAMQQAQKLGYPPGDREAAQLADGYRARGDGLLRTARQYAGMPQEDEYLRRAEEAYREALTRYEQVSGYDGVAANLRRTRRALEQLEARKEAIELAREIRLPGIIWPLR